MFSCEPADDGRGSGRSAPKVLMIKDSYGKWTFPKGLIEKGETPEVAALREVREETGVSGVIERDLSSVNYFYTLNKQVISKTVYYFLVRSDRTDPVPQLSEILDARWVEPGEALGLSGYENNLGVLKEAIAAIEAIEGTSGDKS